MDAPSRERGQRKRGVLPCSVSGCTRKVHVKGLCSMHYQRLKTRGDVGVPESRVQPGLRRKSRAGYIYIDGKAEHKIVMERVLGRELLPREHVHHRNGVRDDNRPENLELWINQPAGQRVEDLVAFVKTTYLKE